MAAIPDSRCNTRSPGEHSYTITHHTPLPWRARNFIPSSHRGRGSWHLMIVADPKESAERGAQNWPGRFSMTVIAGSVVDDLPSGTRDDTHRSSLCFHEGTRGILIFLLLRSPWHPRSPFASSASSLATPRHASIWYCFVHHCQRISFLDRAPGMLDC